MALNAEFCNIAKSKLEGVTACAQVNHNLAGITDCDVLTHTVGCGLGKCSYDAGASFSYDSGYVEVSTCTVVPERVGLLIGGVLAVVIGLAYLVYRFVLRRLWRRSRDAAHLATLSAKKSHSERP